MDLILERWIVKRGGVTVDADADAKGMLQAEVPVRPSRSSAVGAINQGAKLPVGSGFGVSAALPLTMDFLMTVGTVVRLGGIGIRGDPGIVVVVFAWQEGEFDTQGCVIGRNRADAVTRFGGGNVAPDKWPG